MMIPNSIASWAASGESETLEFKRSTAERREAAQSICAMLNQRGGRVVIGIEPSGRVVGQEVSDRTIERLSQELNLIDPPALPSVDRVSLGNNLEALVISVTTGQNKPYTYHGAAYRRVGNTNHRLSRHEYNQLLLEHLHGESRWENEPASGWSVDDLDDTEIVRAVEEAVRNGRLENPGPRESSELLRGMGLVSEGHPLRAAAVLFGRDDSLPSYYPQCLLRVARFRGVDQSEFLDNRQFHGNAFTLLRRAEQFLRENLPIAGHFISGQIERVDEPLYPPLATREALANAFCHRDYSIGGGSVAVAIYDDRLEITSSGTLHFGLTAQALFEPHLSLPWNPIIARVFYLRGIIESWGRGVINMVELVKQAGLPQPEIEEIGGGVTVRFRPSRYVPPQRIGHNLSDRQRIILALLNDSPSGLALREIAPQIESIATLRQVREDLRFLRSLELITSNGWGRGAKWIRL